MSSDYSDIQPELDDFENAVYGEEVRGSMVSAIKKIYDIAERAAGAPDASSATEGQVLTADGNGGHYWGDVATSGDSVPTEVRQAILALFQNGVYTRDDMSDEVAVIQSWATEITAISVSPTTLNINGMNQQTIVATTQPAGGIVTWSSSDESIATVAGGVVTPTGVNGTCTITASCGGKSATCAVTISGFATLLSISATYTQSGSVYDTDTLDSLKSDLVVTANYDDDRSVPVTNYTLSGTLAEGTSTITVSYGGKTTTFTVNVSAKPYVTDGLIHYWDAIDNTSSGHNANASAWEDLVGDNDLTLNSTEYATWGDDYLMLSGNAAQFLDCVGGQIDNTLCTVEIVLSPSSNATQVVMYVGKPNRSVLLFSDGTFNMNGVSNASYPTGLNDFSDIHSLVALYNASVATGKYYLNNVEKTQGSATHSMSASWTDRMRIGATPGATAGYAYSGKIHAIRIYNRHLTAEELSANYNSDLSRFGLE